MSVEAHVFDDDHNICHLAEIILPTETELDMTILCHRGAGEVADALAFVGWEMGKVAVVDLCMNGLLGRQVVEYIADRHPTVGMWGITGMSPDHWPAWALERCERVFLKNGYPRHFFGHLARDIERFVEGA